MIVQIEPFENVDHVKCVHTRCDGRDAKWQFPETANRAGGKVVSCRVHIGHFVQILVEEAAAGKNSTADCTCGHDLNAPDCPIGRTCEGHDADCSSRVRVA